MAQYDNNPEYTRHDIGEYVFYTPCDFTQYHQSRYLAMQVQDIYSRCGISRDVLSSMVDEMIIRCNKELKIDTLRSDMAVLANNLKYRIDNIVDEKCAIRMGAIAVFLTNEDDKTVSDAWTRRKVDMAEKDPLVRDFFLHLGIALTPQYQEVLRGLEAEEYLANRAAVIDGLTLQSTQTNT